MLVQNHGNYVRNIGARLIPGVNNLSREESKAYAEEVKLPLNQVLVKSKEIEVVSDTDITAVSEAKAVELVNDTFDLGLLDQFKAAENGKGKRKNVLAAIDAQINAIKNPPKDKIVNQEK